MTPFIPLSKIRPGMLLRTTWGKVGRVLDKNPKQYTVTLLIDGEPTVVELAYVVGREEEHPLAQIHPMLATTAKEEHLEALLDSPDWGAEPKYDGERQILTYIPGHELPDGLDEKDFAFTGVGYFRATTRVVGDNSGVLGVNTRKLPQFYALKVPNGGATVLDVELLHSYGATIEEQFRNLRSIMGSSDERALQRQKEIGYVYAVAFDVLWLDGEDLRNKPFSERRARLEEWWARYVEGTAFEDIVRLAPLQTKPEAKRTLLDLLLAQGWEGMMLKRLDAPYTDTTVTGQRSKDLLKVKPFKEDDVIITGFGFGTGEYNQHRISRITFAQFVRPEDLTDKMTPLPSHQIAAWEGLASIPNNGMVLVDMGQTSGLTYEQEEMFRADMEGFVGKVMQVRYQQRWPETGKMRHPAFVRIRDDKTPKDCVYRRDA